MSADTIRLTATYGIAVLVLVGAFYLLVYPSQVAADRLDVFVTGVIGLVLGWVFNRESTAAGARAQERATAQGATTVATGTGAATGGT